MTASIIFFFAQIVTWEMSGGQSADVLPMERQGGGRGGNLSDRGRHPVGHPQKGYGGINVTAQQSSDFTKFL